MGLLQPSPLTLTCALLMGACLLACIEDPPATKLPSWLLRSNGSAGAEMGAAGGAIATTGAGGSSGTGGHLWASAVGPCYPTDPSCGVMGSSCLAKVDTSGSSIKTLRISQLKIQKPAVLASPFIQSAVITPSVLFDEEQCYLKSPQKGGLFNWIFEIDLEKRTLKTGGAAPVQDPKHGYCFLTTKVGRLQAQPVNGVAINYSSNTSALSTVRPMPRVVVPIYLDSKMQKPPVLLPLTNAQLTSVTVSEGGNCIGRFKGAPGELDSDRSNFCQPLPSSSDAFQFVSGGQLDALITLEDADLVPVADAGNISLCSLLTGQTTLLCARNAQGGIIAQGDTSTQNNGINDAFSMGAAFAASAIKINGDCQ